jgi:hypothetical protein
VGRLGGPSGPPRRGPCLCVFERGVFSFGFLQVLSGVSPVVKGTPRAIPDNST